MAKISLIVNGTPVNANVDPRTLLVQFLRENLRLTGTHVGCDTSQCGACVVHVNGKALKSCTTFAWQVEGACCLCPYAAAFLPPMAAAPEAIAFTILW